MNFEFSNDYHRLLVEYENKLYARDAAINEAICAAILEGIKEEKKNMNVKYNHKNECFYTDIDLGEVFSPLGDNGVYMKILGSYTSSDDDGIYFNAIKLQTGARSWFNDGRKVIRYKDAKVVINTEE